MADDLDPELEAWVVESAVGLDPVEQLVATFERLVQETPDGPPVNHFLAGQTVRIVMEDMTVEHNQIKVIAKVSLPADLTAGEKMVLEVVF